MLAAASVGLRHYAYGALIPRFFPLCQDQGSVWRWIGLFKICEVENASYFLTKLGCRKFHFWYSCQYSTGITSPELATRVYIACGTVDFR